jgi:hypothetical protein
MLVDIPKISQEIINNNYLTHNKFNLYLKEKGISENHWAGIVSDIIIKLKDERKKDLLLHTIRTNTNQLACNIDNFISLLEVIANKYNSFEQIHDLVVSLDIDLEAMNNLYYKISLSGNPVMKKIRGTVLGLIGRRLPEILFQEVVTNIDTTNFDKRISIMRAIYMASYKPFRHRDFHPTKRIFDFVISSLQSENNELSYLALNSVIRLFDLESGLFDILRYYVAQSDIHRSNFLYAIHYEKLVENDSSELKLLAECCKTESSQLISQVFQVFADKLASDNSYKKDLQRIILHLVKKWSSHKDFLYLSKDTYLLGNIAKTDINYAYGYIRQWILNHEYDEWLYRLFYPNLIYYTFRDLNDKFADFLNELVSSKNTNFDNIIEPVMKEMVSDVRSQLDREFYIYNSASIRKLKELTRNTEIDKLVAKNLDDMPHKLNAMLEVLDRMKVLETNPDYPLYNHHRLDMERKKQLFDSKFSQIKKCLNLLIEIAERRNISYRKPIRGLRGQDINSTITKCEILRDFIFTKKYEEMLDYDIVRTNFMCFPNISKYFGYEWLKKEYDGGPPYHTLLIWLSKIVDQIQLNQICSDFKKEKDEIEKMIKKENIRKILLSFTWVEHVNKCLGFFSKENEQGKKIITQGLKDDGNFFQFLTQLELGLTLKEHGFKVSLEDTSIIDKPRIDILASKNGRTLIFELVTPDMYSELKYSGFAPNVPDRVESTLFRKINEQVSKYKDKTSAPIIVVIIFPATAPMVLNNTTRVGSKFLLRAADMSTGKYGIGMNTIMLDTKLNSTIPKYPSSKPKLKKFSIMNKVGSTMSEDESNDSH